MAELIRISPADMEKPFLRVLLRRKMEPRRAEACARVFTESSVDGLLSDDPGAILASGRPLTIGYWKGAGHSLVLDLLRIGIPVDRTIWDTIIHL